MIRDDSLGKHLLSTHHQAAVSNYSHTWFDMLRRENILTYHSLLQFVTSVVSGLTHLGPESRYRYNYWSGQFLYDTVRGENILELGCLLSKAQMILYFSISNKKMLTLFKPFFVAICCIYKIKDNI